MTSCAEHQSLFPSAGAAAALGHADGHAQAMARLQAQGRPWICSKRKMKMSNDTCATDKLSAVFTGKRTSPCHDCGLPLAMGWVKKEELGMANGTCECCGAKGVIYRKGGVNRCYHCHKSEAEPMGTPNAAQDAGPISEGQLVGPSEDKPAPTSEPSWEDFKAIMPMVTSRPCLITIGPRLDRICLNSTLQRTLGWKKGGKILIRISESTKAVAFRLCPEKHEEKAYSLTSGGNSSIMAVACKTAMKVLGAAPGAYEITKTSWGFVAHLDRPFVGRETAA